MWLLSTRPDSSKWITNEDLESVKKNPRSSKAAKVREKLMDIFNDDETNFWKEFQQKAELRCIYTGRNMEDALYNSGHLLWNTRQALAYQKAKTQPKPKQHAARPTVDAGAEDRTIVDNNSLMAILSRGRATLAAQAPSLLQKGSDVDDDFEGSDLKQLLQNGEKKVEGKSGKQAYDAPPASDDDSVSTAALTLDSAASCPGRKPGNLKSSDSSSWRSINKYVAKGDSNSSMASKLLQQRGSTSKAKAA